RHFPTKEALFEAIVLTRLSDLVDATKCCDEDDPGRAFFDFLMKMAEQVSLKHDLFDALAEAGIDFKARCGDSVEELEQGLDHLRRLAVDSGQVRGDVTTSEVMGLVIGACHGADRAGIDKQSSLQMMKVVCDGLKTR
ncbi:MAG: TetR/AcrR family transcriptional regulator, partial [Acidimicrobiales bacterium]